MISIKRIYNKILCLTGLHNWKYSTNGIKEGTERVCTRCETREKYTFPFTPYYNPWVKS